MFDKRVLAQKPGEVIFLKGDLVQIYRSDLDHTFKTERKLLPKWSTPQRILSIHLNSYVLETLNADTLPGSFSARRLRRFIPKEGSRLADEQKLIEGIGDDSKVDNERSGGTYKTPEERDSEPLEEDTPDELPWDEETGR